MACKEKLHRIRVFKPRKTTKGKEVRWDMCLIAVLFIKPT